MGVDSVAGEGSVFWIKLPMAEAGTPSAERIAAQSSGQTGRSGRATEAGTL